MNALNYLNQVIINKYAYIPMSLISTVAAAGAALGYCLCGGEYDATTRTQVLYIA